jgi:PAS domain S-box-containing protein
MITRARRELVGPEMDKDSMPELLAAVPGVIWVRLAGTGAVLYCNAAYEDIWRRPLSELQQHPTSWLWAIHEADRAELEAALGKLRQDERFEQEYRVVSPEGDCRWVLDRGKAVRDAPDAALRLVGSVHDISTQKRVETALRSTFDALNSSVNGVILTDEHGRITYANPSFLSLFGYTSESETVGRQADTLFLREDIEGITDVVDEVTSGGAVAREFKVRTKDGSERIVEVMSSDIHDVSAQRIGSMASFVDVTERKMLEQTAQEDSKRMRWLSERLAKMEEQERRRIAAQLHDTAVQSFTLTNIKLGMLGNALKAAGLTVQEQQLEAVRALVSQGIAECRLIMADLIPPLLYEVGLDAALRELGDRVRRLFQTSIHIEEHPAVEVPESLRGVLFQAARELVLNACKHAGASCIHISWHNTPTWFRMQVSDDGNGFDPAQARWSQPSESNGFGLFSIRERVRGLGGRLQIESQPAAGTVIQVWLPRTDSRPIP